MHIFRGAAGSEFICEWCQPSGSGWPKRRPDLCTIATCPQHGRVWHYRKDAALLDAAPLLLAALESVGFVDGSEPATGMGGMMEQVCPWCDKVGTSDDGWAHNPGCIRQAAIAAARGTTEEVGYE